MASQQHGAFVERTLHIARNNSGNLAFTNEQYRKVKGVIIVYALLGSQGSVFVIVVGIIVVVVI